MEPTLERMRKEEQNSNSVIHAINFQLDKTEEKERKKTNKVSINENISNTNKTNYDKTVENKNSENGNALNENNTEPNEELKGSTLDDAGNSYMKILLNAANTIDNLKKVLTRYFLY